MVRRLMAEAMRLGARVEDSANAQQRAEHAQHEDSANKALRVLYSLMAPTARRRRRRPRSSAAPARAAAAQRRRTAGALLDEVTTLVLPAPAPRASRTGGEPAPAAWADACRAAGGPPPTSSSAYSLWCHPRVYSAENVQNLLGARLGLAEALLVAVRGDSNGADAWSVRGQCAMLVADGHTTLSSEGAPEEALVSCSLPNVAPRMQRPACSDIQTPELSKLAFITQYEALLNHLNLVKLRAAPLAARLATKRSGTRLLRLVRVESYHGKPDCYGKLKLAFEVPPPPATRRRRRRRAANPRRHGLRVDHHPQHAEGSARRDPVPRRPDRARTASNSPRRSSSSPRASPPRRPRRGGLERRAKGEITLNLLVGYESHKCTELH